MARTNILQNTKNIHLAKTRERASKEESIHKRTGYEWDQLHKLKETKEGCQGGSSKKGCKGSKETEENAEAEEVIRLTTVLFLEEMIHECT